MCRRQKNNKYLYNVVGEKKFQKGLKILKRIKSNKNPEIVDDKNFSNFYSKLIKDNRIKASVDDTEYSDADVIFVCSNCDFDFVKNRVKTHKLYKKYRSNLKKN